MSFLYDKLSEFKRKYKSALNGQAKNKNWEKYIQRNIIHFSGHRRNENFVAPNFTRLIIKPKYAKNDKLRDEFCQILISLGVRQSWHILSQIYPSSHRVL